MPDARVISHAARGWRLAAGLVVVTVAVAAEQACEADRRTAAAGAEGARRGPPGQPAWVDGQAAAASDSLAVLTALVKDRGEEVSRGVPTLWPVRGLVTSPFGARTSPYGEGREMHPGIDISASYGSPV